MQVQRQYALKYNFIKIEFENSIRRLSFLCCLPDIKIASSFQLQFPLTGNNSSSNIQGKVKFSVTTAAPPPRRPPKKFVASLHQCC